MIYLLDLRANDSGGAVVPGRIVRPATAGVALGGEDDLRREGGVTFLLHGYNVNRRNGTASLLRLAAKITPVAGQALVAVLWPGDHWTRALSYSFEGRDADDSAAELVRWIERALLPGVPLSFVTHSLGARVALEAVKRLRGGSRAVGQVCLMAPAVDDFSLAHPKAYRDAGASAARVAVLASRKDKVLRYAYPAGDLLQSFVFFRKDLSGLALGYHGPRPYRGAAVAANVLHVQIPEGRDVSHGDYVPEDAPNPQQVSATAFADAMLQGAPQPRYA